MIISVITGLKNQHHLESATARLISGDDELEQYHCNFFQKRPYQGIHQLN